MKGIVRDIKGEKLKEIELPKLFSEDIREDIVFKVLESKKVKQPYAPSPVAGKQHSARGKMRHRRHVWKSQYGRGSSRVPRKMLMGRGSQFNWEAAGVPNARGGMRAHPPKILSMMNLLKINKKELKKAFASSISATGKKEILFGRYNRLEGEIKNLPIIVDSKITQLKTKEMISSLKNLLGENLFDIALSSKKIRSGKGKLRGRKYKKSAGVLLVLGDGESIKTKVVDSKSVNKLGLNDLAKGGLGRLTVYTEQAIRDLGNLRKTKEIEETK